MVSSYTTNYFMLVVPFSTVCVQSINVTSYTLQATQNTATGGNGKVPPLRLSTYGRNY